MPRKVYTHEESLVVFAPAGPVNFAPVVGLPVGSGALSDPYDFGVAARPSLFEWRGRTALASGVPVVAGQTVELYFSTSDDGTWFDANLGSGHRVLADVNKTRNLQWFGSLNVEDGGSGVSPVLVNSGLVQVFGSKAAVVFWNQTTAPFTSVSGDHQFYLKPVPDEIQ